MVNVFFLLKFKNFNNEWLENICKITVSRCLLFFVPVHDNFSYCLQCSSRFDCEEGLVFMLFKLRAKVSCTCLCTVLDVPWSFTSTIWTLYHHPLVFCGMGTFLSRKTKTSKDTDTTLIQSCRLDSRSPHPLCLSRIFLGSKQTLFLWSSFDYGLIIFIADDLFLRKIQWSNQYWICF